MSRIHRAWLPLLTGLVVIGLDLLTKEWALRALAPAYYGPHIKVLPNCLDFRLAYNTGGAFSLFHDKPWLITAGSAIVTVVILGYCIYFLARFPRNVPVAAVAFGLILGGAIGNLIDRVRFQYVVDFIHAYIVYNGREYAWPTFNIADSAIVSGIGIFLILSLFTRLLDMESPTEDAAAPAPEESRA